MPTQAEHQALLKKLLPEGPAWNSSDETDGTTALDGLLSALSLEPERVDAAGEELITLTIPDSLDCDLDAWERLCGLPDACNEELDLDDDQRLAAIQGKLRGRGGVNRSHLQEVLEAFRGGTVLLLDRRTPGFEVGTNGMGYGLYGDQWFATWLCEYITNDLTGSPDVFQSGWTLANVTVTANQFGSPITFSQTADRLDFGSGAGYIEHSIGVGEENSLIQGSIWLRSVSGDHSVQFGIVQFDGTFVSTTYNIGTTWARLSFRELSGLGGASAKMRIAGTGAFSLYASWAAAGTVDTVFECQAQHQMPVNTTGVFMILGENGV